MSTPIARLRSSIDHSSIRPFDLRDRDAVALELESHVVADLSISLGIDARNPRRVDVADAAALELPPALTPVAQPMVHVAGDHRDLETAFNRALDGRGEIRIAPIPFFATEIASPDVCRRVAEPLGTIVADDEKALRLDLVDQRLEPFRGLRDGAHAVVTFHLVSETELSTAERAGTCGH